MLTIRPTYTHNFNITPNLYFYFWTASWTAFCHSVLTPSLLLLCAGFSKRCIGDLSLDSDLVFFFFFFFYFGLPRFGFGIHDY